jgi:CheY-like chemotaxis protein
MINEELSIEDLWQRIQELEQENKRLEKELQKTKEQVIHSENFKSAFLANMSHAVRTPMNAIIGFSGLIGMEGISPNKKGEYIRIINEKGHQLLSLIDDIIEISKIESGKIQFAYNNIDINEFLNEVYLSTFNKKLTTGKDLVEIILEKNSSDDLGLIQTDSGRLQQIFNNILSFSLRNTNKGLIKFGYNLKDPKTIVFYVIDTGIGLGKDDLKLLFDYFWQFEDITHQRLVGIGLGLTISKILIELFGGKMWVTSELNVGTEFYFSLPVERSIHNLSLKNQTELYPKIENEKIETNWKNKVILVVEDEMVNYEFIEALMESYQVKLLHAENGDQALELVKTINKIDLILMDIKLPEINGYEITSEIKKIRNEIPIIALTAFSINEVRDKCLKAGCEDVIAKPVEINAFISKLNHYLNSA